jgi:F-type H+-transporting ATPase subunit gamma
MPSLKDIRKRISSVKNTQKITRALKLVSAAKLNRSQREMSRLKPYAMKQEGLIRDLVAEVGGEGSPLFETRTEVKEIAVLLICSDRGMCGGFNSNALKHFRTFVAEKEAEGAKVSTWTIGKRAAQFVTKQSYTLGANLGEALRADLMNDVPEMAESFTQGFLKGSFDEVFIVSNRFINAITQTPKTHSLLPIVPPSDVEAASGAERIYEPDQQTLLNFILPRAIETQIRQAILESITGEHAARMNAMNNATDNASDMINTLTLDLNRARQAAITAELMEIISGAEALK